MIKRRMRIALLFLILCFLPAGCGKDEVRRHEDGRIIVTISNLAANSDYEYDVVAKGVTLFNQSNPDYYIEILEKENGQEVSDYAQRERLALSTNAGPDIFSNNTDYMFASDAENGIMEDLMPYIERDLNPDDFLECSLYAYAKDGKVFALEPSFVISTMIGDEAIFGERTGWNMEDAQQIMEANPQIALYMDCYGNEGEFLRSFLFQGDAVYTDYDALREAVYFDKAYHGSLPEDVMAIPGENVMVEQANIYDPLDLVDLEALYEKKIVPIGYVNENKQGNYHEGKALSINASSKQKEGAWEFLKFLLSEEFQRECVTIEISPRKDIFEERLEYYSKPISYNLFLEEIGEEVTVTENHSLNRASNAKHTVVEVECASKEQIDKFRLMVESSRTNCFSKDYKVVDLIREEVDFYFSGERTLDDVMSNIQKRLELYYAEKQ